MQNYNYYYPPLANYIEDQRALLYNASLPQNNHQTNSAIENDQTQSSAKSNSRIVKETPTKREQRLTRNAERMRERRSMETADERRKRLDRNALSNRIRRLNENPDQKKMRQARNAARQRLRRAMETQEERDSRLKKLSERMREVRSKDDPLSQQPYTPRGDSKKQSSYSEDDSFDTSVSVDSNPLAVSQSPNVNFFGGNDMSSHPLLYNSSHNPSSSQIINNHAEDTKSFFSSSLKLSPSAHNNHQDPLFMLEEEELSKSQIKLRRESPEARERRLHRNAERMRQKRAAETDDQRRERLNKNALNNRLRRLGESPQEKAVRHVRDATRQRIRRALESDDERDTRLKKLAKRMRETRKKETPEDKIKARGKSQKSSDDIFSQNSYTSDTPCLLNIPQYHSVFQSSSGFVKREPESSTKFSEFAKKSTAPFPRNPSRKNHQHVFTNFSEAQTTALILEPIIEMNFIDEKKSF